MPTIHQPDVSDPIELRLRHLGDHLDAEREARSQQSSVLPTAGPNAGTHVGDIDPGSDAQGRSPNRWWAAAAASVAVVAAGAVIVANRGSSTVQSTPATTSDATTPQITVESTVPETTPTATSPAGSASSMGGSTLPDDSAVDGIAVEAAWKLWPDDASVQSGQLQPGKPGPVILSAAGPNGVVYAAPTSDTVDVADIWVTPDGVQQISAANDDLSGLWQPEVAATSDAYFVAAATEQGGEKALWRSTNGLDWTELARPFDGYLVEVLGGPGPTLFRFPAGDASGDEQPQIEWSDDGLIWTPVAKPQAGASGPSADTIFGIAWIGGEHGYLASTETGQVAESADGHRWTVLPPPPAIGSPALVDGGIIMLSDESEDCAEPCPQAYRFDDQSQQWSPVATPPFDEHLYLARVGDTLVAAGPDPDGAGQVFVSPVDEIAWSQVEVDGDLAANWLGQVYGVENRVIIPAGDATGLYGRFVVGTVAGVTG